MKNNRGLYVGAIAFVIMFSLIASAKGDGAKKSLSHKVDVFLVRAPAICTEGVKADAIIIFPSKAEALKEKKGDKFLVVKDHDFIDGTFDGLLSRCKVLGMNGQFTFGALKLSKSLNWPDAPDGKDAIFALKGTVSKDQIDPVKISNYPEVKRIQAEVMKVVGKLHLSDEKTYLIIPPKSHGLQFLIVSFEYYDVNAYKIAGDKATQFRTDYWELGYTPQMLFHSDQETRVLGLTNLDIDAFQLVLYEGTAYQGDYSFKSFKKDMTRGSLSRKLYSWAD